MSVSVEVGLLSGKTVTVTADEGELVEALKLRAQTALGVGRRRLVDSSGSIVDACSTVAAAQLQNNDSLSLHLDRPQIQSACAAFAAILGDGSTMTWGNPDNGGDSSAVQDQLKNVLQIQANDHAFAAILADGSVVTWGHRCYGGDSSVVRDQLKNVQQIKASCGAFAAVLAQGSVVSWGDAAKGGDSSAVQDQLKNVHQIQATYYAFAAILGDGSVVTWGHRCNGGNSSSAQDQLNLCRRFCCYSRPWICCDMG